MLKLENLEIGYVNGAERISVVREINAELHGGELVCLIGANGKGKSTLLRTLSGNQPPLSGTVSINGENVQLVSKARLAKLMSLVFTSATGAGGLTVRELVALGRHPHTGFLGRLSDNDNRIVDTAMEQVGIAHKAKNFVAELSDGERQKTFIAKALAQETPVIFLDEPTAFLDVASKLETLYLLHNLAQKQNKVILLSTHDVAQSLQLADRIWMIDCEGNFLDGETKPFVKSGAINRLFLPSQNITFTPETATFTMNKQ